jgi:hypothetical protein
VRRGAWQRDKDASLELLIPMQKVVGSVSLQIATFRRGLRDFSSAVCWPNSKRFAKRATVRTFQNKKTLRFAGLLESG